MKFFRPIVFALFAFCANGGVWAADEAARPPVQVAQSQDGAGFGDNRRADATTSEPPAETQNQHRETLELFQQLRAQILGLFILLNNALLAIIGILAATVVALIALLWKS